MSRSPVPPPPADAATTGQAMSDASQQGTNGAPPSVRAQLLATEHWSLLAARSTTQSEFLSRITTFLMLVSASIVGLALIGQATRFGGRFLTFALVLLGMVVMIGTLTQIRVVNASNEDLAYVIGMNRLRAAYLELDPGIERYLVTSAHDDDLRPQRCVRRAGCSGPRRTRSAGRGGGGSVRPGLSRHLAHLGAAAVPAHATTARCAVSHTRQQQHPAIGVR